MIFSVTYTICEGLHFTRTHVSSWLHGNDKEQVYRLVHGWFALVVLFGVGCLQILSNVHTIHNIVELTYANVLGNIFQRQISCDDTYCEVVNRLYNMAYV